MPTPRRQLMVTELFHTIAGETSQAGRPATFVRLTGCNLRCAWCDSRHAWEGGQPCSVEALIGAVCTQSAPLVVVTGGEPLLQEGTLDLLTGLLQRGREVCLETNGSLSVAGVPPGVRTIMDLKAPSSGQTEAMDLANLARLRPGDELKVVIADRADFDWLLDLEARHPAPTGVNILVSPAFEQLEGGRLADWLLQSGKAWRIQLQLHRLLWPDGRDGTPMALPADGAGPDGIPQVP